MGPIGCLVGLFAQIIHTVIMLVVLPIIFIVKIFKRSKD